MAARRLNPQLKDRLHSALFGTSLGGITATGEVYPLGAFLLVGAMIDMLAGLMHAPERDNDRLQGARFAAFVDTYFDNRYRTLGMGRTMWEGLRCRPLHNFSAQGILLADSQSQKAMHLRVHDDNVVLHWLDFLDDYRGALERYWSQLQVDPDLQEKAERRCERYPPMMVTEIVYDGLMFPVTFPATFRGVASAYGGPPVEPNPE
jgi:hypothetical protein